MAYKKLFFTFISIFILGVAGRGAMPYSLVSVKAKTEITGTSRLLQQDKLRIVAMKGFVNMTATVWRSAWKAAQFF